MVLSGCETMINQVQWTMIKNKKDDSNYILIIIIIALVIFVFTTWLDKSYNISPEQQLSYLYCCDNMTCSDTYYDVKDDKCHLTQCPQKVFGKEKECIYEPNKTMVKQ